MFRRILDLRIWSLFIKEFHQIRRNRRLVVMLIIPPTLNIILFGLALNPNFENLHLGVVDYIRKPFAMERLLEAVERGLSGESADDQTKPAAKGKGPDDKA